jgi:peptidoglycan hydrolase-like protein with peptidoglycan-binding domain
MRLEQPGHRQKNRRNAMVVITQTIQPGERRGEVTEIQKALIGLGASIASDELFTATTAGTYGPSTQAAVNALRGRFRFLVSSPVFNVHTGRLLNLAVGAEVGNSAALQKAVRESFATVQMEPAADPGSLMWLARYATIARDFATARKAIDLIPDGVSVDLREQKEKIAAIVGHSTLQPTAPEESNPENYYTVLNDYVSLSRINALLGRT